MLVTASGQRTIKAPSSKTLAPSNSSLHGILQHPGRSPQLFAAAMQIKHPSFHLSTSDFFFPKASYIHVVLILLNCNRELGSHVCLFDRFCAFNSLNHDHLSINVPSIHHHHCHPHDQDRGPLTPSNRGRWNHRWIVDCEIWSGPASKSSNKIPVFHPLKTCHRFQVSFCDAISAEALQIRDKAQSSATDCDGAGSIHLRAPVPVPVKRRQCWFSIDGHTIYYTKTAYHKMTSLILISAGVRL